MKQKLKKKKMFFLSQMEYTEAVKMDSFASITIKMSKVKDMKKKVLL